MSKIEQTLSEQFQHFIEFQALLQKERTEELSIEEQKRVMALKSVLIEDLRPLPQEIISSLSPKTYRSFSHAVLVTMGIL